MQSLVDLSVRALVKTTYILDYSEGTTKNNVAHFATMFSSLSGAAFQDMVKVKANFNVKNIYGQNALHTAIKRNNHQDIGVFLTMGDPVILDLACNSITSSRETPLHLAAKMGSVATVWKLLQLGADTGARDENGNTPYDAALKKGNNIIADIITNYEANAGKSPYHLWTSC